MAITNPVWFRSAQLPPYGVERRALFHTELRPDGSWGIMRPLPGAAPDAASFAGVQSAAAGMADGSVVVLGVAPDNGLWLTTVRGQSTIRPWQRVAGPDGSTGSTVREADIAAFPDGTCQIVVTAMDGVLQQQRRADGTLPGFRALPGLTAQSRWGATKVSITGMPDGSAQVLAIGLDGLVYHQERRPDGSWTGFRPPRGVTTSTMGASAIGIAGTPDGSAQVVPVGLDGRIWHNARKPDGSWTPFSRPPGPNGRDPFPAGQVRITALRDGTTHVTAISAGQPEPTATRQDVGRRIRDRGGPGVVGRA